MCVDIKVEFYSEFLLAQINLVTGLGIPSKAFAYKNKYYFQMGLSLCWNNFMIANEKYSKSCWQRHGKEYWESFFNSFLSLISWDMVHAQIHDMTSINTVYMVVIWILHVLDHHANSALAWPNADFFIIHFYLTANWHSIYDNVIFSVSSLDGDVKDI